MARFRGQREALAPLIEVQAQERDAGGDIVLDIEATNLSATTMVIETVEVLRPKDAILVRSIQVTTQGLVDGQKGRRIRLDRPVARAGTRSSSFGRGPSGFFESREGARTDTALAAVFLRLAPGSGASTVMLRFTTRLKTNRNRLITTKVWQDLPPR